jgi:hypothetical protein
MGIGGVKLPKTSKMENRELQELGDLLVLDNNWTYSCRRIDGLIAIYQVLARQKHWLVMIGERVLYFGFERIVYPSMPKHVFTFTEETPAYAKFGELVNSHSGKVTDIPAMNSNAAWLFKAF